MKQTLAIWIALIALAPASAADPDDGVVLPVPIGTPAPSLSEEIATLRADAVNAYGAGAYELYLHDLQELDLRLPNHPDITLRLAAAQARTGKLAEALDTLTIVADMGVTVDFDADARNAEDFKSLQSRSELAHWRERMKLNAQPHEAGKVWHRFGDAALLAEDITYDPRGRAFYVSSVLRHKVVRIGQDGKESGFALEAPEKDWNVLGVAVDANRGVLWVSAQAIRGFPGIAPSDTGKSRLSAYGLKSGKRLYTHEFEPQGKRQAAVADVAVAPSGELFAADSEQARLYRVAADRRYMDALQQPFLSPQDIAIRDDRVAFVADYARGIARIDLSDGALTWVTAPRSVALNGIDGLYTYGGGLLAIQNGTRPARIVYLPMTQDGTRVLGNVVLEQGAEVLGDPTHGVIVENDLVYIANSGWDQVDAHGLPKAGAKRTPPVLRRLKLKSSLQEHR